QDVACVSNRDVRHGGPHGALVRIGAAKPAAEQEELGEKLLAHGRALGGEGVHSGGRSRFGTHDCTLEYARSEAMSRTTVRQSICRSCRRLVGCTITTMLSEPRPSGSGECV